VQLLEELAQHIHHRIKLQFEDMVQKIKVCVRKLHPPFSNEVAFSQVCWEG
jgi:dihydroneopterin aldolase